MRAPSPRRRLPSATSSASATRFSCASSEQERAAARDAATAVAAGVAERAAEGTRVAFVDRLADAASALAEAPRGGRPRVARARRGPGAEQRARRARPRSPGARARGSPRPWRRREPEGTRVSAPPRTPSPRRTTPRLRRIHAARGGAAERSARSSGSRGSRCRAREGRGARAAERSHIVGGRDRACERAGGVRGRAASAGARRRRVDARGGGGGGAEVGTRFFLTIPVPVRSNAPRRRRPGRRHPADRGEAPHGELSGSRRRHVRSRRGGDDAVARTASGRCMNRRVIRRRRARTVARVARDIE